VVRKLKALATGSCGYRKPFAVRNHVYTKLSAKRNCSNSDTTGTVLRAAGKPRHD
jgi:hypothetical protein